MTSEPVVEPMRDQIIDGDLLDMPVLVLNIRQTLDFARYRMEQQADGEAS